MANLILISSPERAVYQLDKDRFRIGRSPENDLFLDASPIAPEHAEIKRIDGRYYISALPDDEELDVNGLKTRETLLFPGDIITIDRHKILFDDHLLPAETAGHSAPAMQSEDSFLLDKKSLALSLPDFAMFDEQAVSRAAALPPGELISLSSRSYSLIYHVARVLSSLGSLEGLLEQTLKLIVDWSSAQRGVFFARKENGDLEPAVSISRDRAPLGDLSPLLAVAQRSIRENSSVVCSDLCYAAQAGEGQDQGDQARSVICIPVWDGEHTYGAIYLDNPKQNNAFDEQATELITVVSSLMALRLKQEKLQEMMREKAIFLANLERFHSPDVAQLIMEQSRNEEGWTELLNEREVTVLFADISDFTSLIETIEAHKALDLLTDYFTEMTDIIFKYKGTVDKFIGDAIMAIFGAPISHGNDAELAIFTAIEMMRRMKDFKETRKVDERFDIRIGVNTGVVLSGYMGSRSRLEYSVLGDPVNIAARLQDLARPREILVGESTYSHTRGIFQFTDMGTMPLRGKKIETRVYKIIF